MTKDSLKIDSAGSTVTVERSGARSVNLGQVLSSDRGREQLRQIQKIQDRQAGCPDSVGAMVANPPSQVSNPHASSCQFTTRSTNSGDSFRASLTP